MTAETCQLLSKTFLFFCNPHKMCIFFYSIIADIIHLTKLLLTAAILTKAILKSIAPSISNGYWTFPRQVFSQKRGFPERIFSGHTLNDLLRQGFAKNLNLKCSSFAAIVCVCVCVGVCGICDYWLIGQQKQ